MTKIKNFARSIDWKNVKPQSYVSVMLFLISMINYVLTYFGQPIIQVSDDKLELLVNGALAIIFGLYPLWKNNSFTVHAQVADMFMNKMRDGKLTEEEAREIINKIDDLTKEKSVGDC